MKIKKDFKGHTEHYYISDDDFMLSYTPYEHDEISGRYYFLEPSTSMTSKAGREGGLVHRRISKADYEKALEESKTRLTEVYLEQDEQPHKELQKDASADKFHFVADRIEGQASPLDSFIPSISAEDMISDLEQDLQYQIKSPHYQGVNSETARYELFGYLTALKDLGLITEEQCFVLPNHFGKQNSPPNTDLTFLNTKAVLDYLMEQKNMAYHNRLCYSQNYLMTKPKDGYDEEWKEAGKTCAIVDELIRVIGQKKETPAEQTPQYDGSFNEVGYVPDKKCNPYAPWSKRRTRSEH